MATDLLGKSLATIALLRGVDFALGVLDQARDQLKLQAQVHQVEDIAEARRSTKNCNWGGVIGLAGGKTDASKKRHLIPGRPGVRRLHLGSGPSAVPWFVVSERVPPVDGVHRARPRPHVGQEVPEPPDRFTPAFAHVDISIVRVIAHLRRRPTAPLDHAFPGHERQGIVGGDDPGSQAATTRTGNRETSQRSARARTLCTEPSAACAYRRPDPPPQLHGRLTPLQPAP